MKYCLWLIGGIVLSASVVMAAQESSEAEAVAPIPPVVDQQLLNDLSRIRQQVGGSVLRGSSLEDGKSNPDKAFKAGVRTLLQQQPPVVPQQEENVISEPFRAPPEHIGPSPARTYVESQAVKQLRQQCEKLDRIANDLEHLQFYGRADEVRASASALRLIARKLDKRLPEMSEPAPTLLR